MNPLKIVATFFLTLSCLSACSNLHSISTSNATCDSGIANIGLMDLHFIHLCGCAEAEGTLAGPGSVLTCTVTSGTEIVFSFIGTFIPHQIKVTGPASFELVTDIYEPDSSESYGLGFTANAAGVYNFIDLLDSELSGQIIAL